MATRAEEEISLLKEEMIRVGNFHTKKHNQLRKLIDCFLTSELGLSSYQKGCLNLLFHQLLTCEVTILNFAECVGNQSSVQLPDYWFTSEDVLHSIHCKDYPDEDWISDSDSDENFDIDDIIVYTYTHVSFAIKRYNYKLKSIRRLYSIIYTLYNNIIITNCSILILD